MKRCLQRIAVALMSVALILTMIPLTGGASYAETQYIVTTGGVSCHVYAGDGGASVVIEDYSGTGTELILPAKVTVAETGKTYVASIAEGPYLLGDYSIKEKAFMDNSKLTKVAIPRNYEAVGSGAFNGCTSLTEVAIGENVGIFGRDVFKGCTNLKTYYIAGTVSGTVADTGIGVDAEGNPFAGVTVWTKEGSAVDLALIELNKTRPADKQINIEHSDDPYAMNTVKPESADPGNTDPGNTDPGNTDPGNTDPGSTDPGSTDPGQSKDPTPSKGKDGTLFGPGASESVVDKAATSWSKESDPKGSLFHLLQAKATAKKTSVTLKWKKAPGAKKYVIYGNACGSTKKLKIVVKKTKKTKRTFKKILGKKVKKGKYYKFMVVAYDANDKVISTSKIVHVATRGGKVGNDKKVTTKAKKNRVTLKVKKKFKLKAKAVPASKKLSVHRHRDIAYESSNTDIAKVTSKGVIKAKKKGKCYVYAYAQNGIFAKIKVTVK